MSGEIEKTPFLPRDAAIDLAKKSAEIGIYMTLDSAPRGWRIQLKPGADLIAFAKLVDTFQVEDKPMLIRYGEKGMEGPGILILAHRVKPTRPNPTQIDQ